MTVYIVTNLSKAFDVKFGDFKNSTKVFTDPKQAIAQYNEWTKNVNGFGMGAFSTCLAPGTKNTRMAGDEGAELLTLETSDVEASLSGGE